MKKFSFLIVVLTISLLSGCIGVSELAYQSIDTNLNSRDYDYQIIRDVTGTASATYVLGIGGMSLDARKLFNNSHKDMMQKAQLKENQRIINIISEEKVRVWLGVVCKHTIYTTGTVIEFTKDKETQANNHSIIQSTKAPAPQNYINLNGVDAIVVSTKSDGTPALLISKEESYVSWADDFYKFNTSLKINHLKDGNSNTNAIKQQTQWQEKYPAFSWCASLGEGWYLPSKEEMELVVKSGVLGSIDEPYLTSTEADVNNCYAVGAKGIQHFDKFKRANVRAIFRIK